jgi:hypothetical protein
MNYKLYPKALGAAAADIITVTCDGWRREGALFLPLNQFEEASEAALIWADNIAAIAPEVPQKPPHNLRDPLHFQIHLKGRTKPLEVAADIVKLVEGEIQFFWLMFNMATSERKDQRVLDLYVAASEVVAVVPSEPLPHRNMPTSS